MTDPIGTEPSTPDAFDVAWATAQLRVEHKQETSALQHGVDRLTALVGQPGFVAVLAVLVVAWVIANLAALGLGFRPLDPPPFSSLQGAASTGALLLAALILTTQRREDQLANHRAQLILELPSSTTRKSPKSSNFWKNIVATTLLCPTVSMRRRPLWPHRRTRARCWGR